MLMMVGYVSNRWVISRMNAKQAGIQKAGTMNGNDISQSLHEYSELEQAD